MKFFNRDVLVLRQDQAARQHRNRRIRCGYPQQAQRNRDERVPHDRSRRHLHTDFYEHHGLRNFRRPRIGRQRQQHRGHARSRERHSLQQAA